MFTEGSKLSAEKKGRPSIAETRLRSPGGTRKGSCGRLERRRGLERGRQCAPTCPFVATRSWKGAPASNIEDGAHLRLPSLPHVLSRPLDGEVSVASGNGVDDRLVLGKGLVDPPGRIVGRLLEPAHAVLDLGKEADEVKVAAAVPKQAVELPVEIH